MRTYAAAGLWFGVFLVLVLALGSGRADAVSIIPSPLAVDFRTLDWQGAAHNQHSHTVDGVTATALPAAGAVLFANDAEDGLGVIGGEFDEVDGAEILEVSFATPRSLSGVWITDLFAAPDGGDGEDGQVEVFFSGGGSAVISFNGNVAHQANGELLVSFGGGLVERAVFRALDLGGPGNEFSVAGFATPEPSSTVLFGLGWLVVAWEMRRPRAANCSRR